MRTMKELVPIYAEYGYKELDLNFCEMMNPYSELKNRDRAKEYIKRLKEYKAELGIEYIQCHLPYRLKDEDKNNIEDIVTALGFCEEIEIPVAVIHPIKGSIDENIGYFENLAPYIPSGVNIAIENMETKAEIYSIEQLLSIINSLSFKAGICLDTGHANMTGEDIPNFIKTAGDILVATHIADNNSMEDQHLLPGFGTIDWEMIIPIFKKYYNGYLNYEAMFFSKRLSEKAIPDTIRLSRTIGSWLLSL